MCWHYVVSFGTLFFCYVSMFEVAHSSFLGGEGMEWCYDLVDGCFLLDVVSRLVHLWARGCGAYLGIYLLSPSLYIIYIWHSFTCICGGGNVLILFAVRSVSNGFRGDWAPPRTSHARRLQQCFFRFLFSLGSSIDSWNLSRGCSLGWI